MAGLFSSNRSAKTQSTTDIDYSSTGVQDTQGNTVTGTDNVLNVTDGGAVSDSLGFAGQFGYDALNFGRDSVAANLEISQAALDLGRRANDNATSLGQFGMDAGTYLAGRGIDAVELANDSILVANRDALDFGQRSLAGVLDAVDMGYGFADNAATRATNFATDALYAGNAVARSALTDALAYSKSMFASSVDANQKATAANLTGMTALARETSASADDRVSKVAGYALLAIAAAIALPAVFRGRAA